MHIPIRSISVFHAVAQAGSISRAAEQLRVTPSAVSQQIHALEVHLGIALIAKDGRRIVLTEAGEQYYEMISHGVESITEATHRIKGIMSVKSLTIRATPSLSTKWILPRLKSFIDKNPNIKLHIDATNEPTIFGKENVDLEIRHGDGNWPGLYVECIAEEKFFPVCSPALCEADSLDAHEIGAHRLIHSAKSQVPWERWFASADVESSEKYHRLVFDRSHMVIDAAVKGMGIALESNLMTFDHINCGDLVCPIRDTSIIKLSTHWVVCPYDHLRLNKVKTFLDWLRYERDIWLAEAKRMT